METSCWLEGGSMSIGDQITSTKLGVKKFKIVPMGKQEVADLSKQDTIAFNMSGLEWQITRG